MAPAVAISSPPLATGFQKQPTDYRDWLYKPPKGLPNVAAVDLRNTHKVQRDPYNQGGLGSCTANAICEALRYAYAREQTVRNPPWFPSRLFLYYMERIALGVGEVLEPKQLQPFLDGIAASLTLADKTITATTIDAAVADDRGAFIRDGMRVLNKYGICSESTWPYPAIPTLFGDEWNKYWADFKRTDKYLKMPQGALAEAPKYISQTFSYWRIKDFYDGKNGLTPADDTLWPGPNGEKWTMANYIQAALTEGYPVVFGFSGPTPSGPNGFFDLAAPFIFDGTIPDRTPEEKTFGHAVTIVGFDAKKRLFTVLNSWDKTWGDGGYFYMPYGQFDAPDHTYTVTRKDGSLATFGRVADLWVLKMNTVTENKTDRLLSKL